MSDRTSSSDQTSDEAYCSACGRSWPIDLDRCPDDDAKLIKLVAKADALIGRVFDERYEIRTALGAGGMGTVYRGWQLSVDREVAIKVIHAKLASDRVAVKRFLREARLSSRLSMPGIVAVYDFGQTDDGILYLVMELIRGHTLAAELEAQRPLSLRRVITIGSHLCDALEAAHGQGIVHRDLKPGNIMILDEPPGRDLLKVLDFGLSKSLVGDASTVVTQSSAMLGTPLYMAPEQIEGRPSDRRADLYALGCILHHLASGQPPFGGTSVNLILSMHLSEAAPALAHVPAPLAKLIAKLMMKNPLERPATAALVRDALQQVPLRGAEELDTTPDTSVQRKVSELDAARTRAERPARRPVWPWLAGGFAIAAVAMIVAMSMARGHREPAASSPPPPRPAPLVTPIVVDAAIDDAIDAAIDAETDAAIAPDAAVAAATRRRPHAPAVDAGVPHVAPVPDAAPSLELLPTH